MVTLGTAGTGLCCPQPGQLLATHLTSQQPSTLEIVTSRCNTMGSTYLSLGIYGGYHCMGGPHCQSLELLSRVSLLLSSVWRCTWSLACPGMQDLIPCVFSHAVWEGSSHPGLSIHGFSLFLPSSMPYTCPLSLGSMPSFPFREGLLSQQTTYCTCQQEQLHLGPLTRTLSFAFFPCHMVNTAGPPQSLLPCPCSPPALHTPIVLLLSVQLPGK